MGKENEGLFGSQARAMQREAQLAAEHELVKSSFDSFEKGLSPFLTNLF